MESRQLNNQEQIIAYEKSYTTLLNAFNKPNLASDSLSDRHPPSTALRSRRYVVLSLKPL